MESEVINVKRTFREKLVDFYNKSKFPITLEPIVFLYTLSVGLNEVKEDNINSSKTDFKESFVSDNQIQLDY